MPLAVVQNPLMFMTALERKAKSPVSSSENGHRGGRNKAHASLQDSLSTRSDLAHFILVLQEDRRPREPADGQAGPVGRGQQ